MAARACTPRAASVHTTVRASDSSPPKNPAVPVISRCRHSGVPPAASSRPTVGENRRHHRASRSSDSRSATGSSGSTSATWQAREPCATASTAMASASDLPDGMATRPLRPDTTRLRRSSAGGSAHAHDTTVIAPRRSRRQTNTGTLRSSGLASSLRCTGHRGSQIVRKRGMRHCSFYSPPLQATAPRRIPSPGRASPRPRADHQR